MARRKESMKSVALWGVVSLLIIAAGLLVSVPPAQAETVKYRTTGYVNKMEVIPVGDVEGHILMVYEIRGLYFAGDEVAASTSWATADFIKGKGQVQGYTIVTYGDGSTTVSKYQLTVMPAPDGKTALYEDGKGEYIKGTGRFEGIKGTYSYDRGKRITPASPGLKETRSDFVIDGTATYTLPPKK